MICPKCSAETRVIDSRLTVEGAVIRRRRVCDGDGCGHRFTTFESTLDVTAHRRRRNAEAKARRAADPEWARQQDAKRAKRRSLRKQAAEEAAETGRPLADVLHAWGVSAPHSLPRQQAQR